MLFFMYSVLMFATTLHGRQIDFERFDQLSGFNVYNSSLRVRKYNRTMVTLNGTLVVMVPLNKSIMISTDLFHSSRGNQQFNHYPVKLPTRHVCEFFDSFYADYSEYMDNIINLPERGECPIQPCTVHIIDKVFPADAIPSFLPPGLWKAHLINSLQDVEIVRFEIIVKGDKLFH